MTKWWNRDEDNILYYEGVPVGRIGITEEGKMIARIINVDGINIDLTEESMAELNQLLEGIKINWESQL